MILRRPSVPIVLSVLVLSPLLATTGLAGEQRPADPLARAVRDRAPAVSAAASPVIAWLAEGAGAAPRRVHGLAWPGVEMELGPDWPGGDDAPAVAGDGRRAWVAAARSSGTGSHLWLRRWQRGRWSSPMPGPASGGHDHHPAIAVGGSTLWVVWVADLPRGSYLEAASWDGSRWSDVEILPSPPVAPMAPAIALDSAGRPAFAWAASDGEDAEIWLTRRRRNGWSRAVPLTANSVPDIEPAVAADGRGLLVAWSGYADGGYVPMITRTRADGRGWIRPAAVSTLPGTPPELVTSSSGPALLWASPTPDGRGYGIRMTRRDRRGWRAAAHVASATSPRFDVGASHGRLLLSWRDTSGPVVASSPLDSGRDGAPSGLQLTPLLAAPRSTTAPVTLPRLPSAYTAFGDSITFGTVVVNGVETASRGYPGYLGDLLASLVGRFVPVINRGLPGEMTSEGLGRLAGIVGLGNATDFMLLLEGANDISVLVHPDTVAFNLQRMVDLVANVDKVPVISLMLPRRQNQFEGPQNDNVDMVNAQIRAYARARGAVLVDNHTPFDGAAHLYSDILHLNDQGYQLMAETWFQELRPIVEALLLRQDDSDGAASDESLRPPEHPQASEETKIPGCC